MECLRYPGAEFGSLEEEPPPFGMSECVSDSRQLPWSAVTEGSLCLESGILGAQVEEVRTPQWKEKEREEELRIPALEHP